MLSQLPNYLQSRLSRFSPASNFWRTAGLEVPAALRSLNMQPLRTSFPMHAVNVPVRCWCRESCRRLRPSGLLRVSLPYLQHQIAPFSARTSFWRGTGSPRAGRCERPQICRWSYFEIDKNVGRSRRPLTGIRRCPTKLSVRSVEPTKMSKNRALKRRFTPLFPLKTSQSRHFPSNFASGFVRALPPLEIS